jgi:2-oxoglutarate/2-oxoacid ferredoxin oxidoreductase subunit alpha
LLLNDVTLCIGGEAGQGVESSGAGLTKALARAGLYAIAVPDYYSRIRGGHNFFTIRISATPVLAVKDKIQVLLALDALTIERHYLSLAPGGAIIVDKTVAFDAAVLDGCNVRLIQAPLLEIAKAEGDEVMVNTAGLALVAGLLEFDLSYLMGVIEDNFGKKGGAVVDSNRRVALTAYKWAETNYTAGFPWKLHAQTGPRLMAVNANQTFAVGSVLAGCKFVAGYPMTPATPVLEYMAQHADEWGLVVKQTESEIAAINMLVGAATAGVRVMAPTSGGGFDLMTEGVSLAAMTESAVVIYLGQRPGPATGLPTRSSQGDLNLALFAGHGEFSRFVFAPHTMQEFYHCAIRAFNLAEKYQCPAIILSDHYIAGTYQTIDVADLDTDNVSIDRGKLLNTAQVDALPGYKRFALTEDGVSPRAIPGCSLNAIFLTSGDEHDEEGHISEDARLAALMAEKRLAKGNAALGDMRPPFRYGPENADITFICWGSSFGAVVEAINELAPKGVVANAFCFTDLWPFPAATAQAALAGSKHLVSVEANAGGQFAQLLQAQTGIRMEQQILRYDGRSFTPDYILSRLEG